MSTQDQKEPTQEEIDSARKENRFMLISIAVVVLVLLAGTGINMLVHKDTSAGAVETTAPSR